MDKFGICYCPVGLTRYDHFGEILHAHYGFAHWVINENSEKIDELIEFINKCSADTILFSCETMYHFFYEQQIEYLKKIFDNFSVRIVCYVRRQDLFLESGFKQQVKVGDFKVSLQDFIKRHTDKSFLDEVQGNYYRMLQRWGDVFSQESIILRIFDKSCFYENSLLKDFYASVNVNEFDCLKRPDTSNNIAFPSDLIEIIRLFNIHGVCPKENHDSFVNYLKNLPFYDNGSLLSYQDRVDILNNYEDVNAKLFKVYGVQKSWKQLNASDCAEKTKDIDKEKIFCSIIYDAWFNLNTDDVVLKNYKLNDLKSFVVSACKVLIKGNFRLLKSILWLNRLNIFSPTFYLEKYPDIAKAKMCPFEHYIKFGWKEYRTPGPNLNRKLLLDMYNKFTTEKHMCW